MITKEQALVELTHRLTDEALEFIVNLGSTTTWKQFEDAWHKEHSNTSMFLLNTLKAN